MLSRTADNLYWLSRYVERAEFVARILDAAHRLASLPTSYGGGETNEWASALASAGVLVIGSAVLYATFSNWSWRAEPAADSPQTMVARLARRLERNPDDLQGWLLLGHSYIVLEQYPLALRSFERADRLAGGRSADALVGAAEALTMSNEAELDGRAGRLIERAHSATCASRARA